MVGKGVTDRLILYLGRKKTRSLSVIGQFVLSV